MKKLFIVVLLSVALIGCETEKLAPKEPQISQETEWSSDWNDAWNSAEPSEAGRSEFSTKDFTDGSGKVKVRFFYKSFSSENIEGSQYARKSVKVSDNYVLIGGSAWVSGIGRSTKYGAFIRESRPGRENDDRTISFEGEESPYNTWWAASQDNLNGDKHTLHIVAIGLKLSGVSPAVLKEYVRVFSNWSGGDACYDCYGNSSYTWVDEDYSLVGGGAAVEGWNSYLVNSYPSNDEGSYWYASAQYGWDGYSYGVTSYAIGIENEIPGFGSLETTIRTASSMVSTGIGQTQIAAGAGKWLISCPGTGVSIDSEGYRFITGTEIHPLGQLSRSISKDIHYETAGTTTAYTIQIRKAQ